MRKVLLINYYWPPASGAGVQRWLKMSKYLHDLGVELSVITVDEDQASYPLSDSSFLAEVDKRIKVVRTKSFEPLRIYSRMMGQKKVPYSGFANVETDSIFSKLFRWIRGNFFIPDARKGWNNYALKAAKEMIDREGIDTVVTTGPPHSTHLVGLQLKRQKGVQWIADFRDPWTDIYYYDQLLHTKMAKRKDSLLESLVLTNADLILTVCPSNLKTISDKMQENEKSKVLLLPNGFDDKDFQEVVKQRFDRFTLVYTGTMAASYDFTLLFQALSKIEFDWKLIIAGSISPEVQKQIVQYGLNQNIDFRGYVKHTEVIQLIVNADLLVHVLPKGQKGTSGKLFEYLGSGTPIAHVGDVDGDSPFYIAEAEAGKSFTDADELVQYIADLKQKQISSDIRSEYSRRSRAKDFVNILDTLLLPVN
ncbi:MAG: glycosyltransferase family 4 protein [Flavobacteriales bacterium]|nr:glycosyltransferase family 4 protein [Flavobacteriales bacterium]